MKLLVALSAVLAVASCASVCQEDQEFHDWKLKFNKTYSSPLEEAERKATWLKNHKLVEVHNILADHEYKSHRLGMNDFSDMEKMYKMYEYKMLISFNSSTALNSSVLLKGGFSSRRAQVDWRQDGYVTNVKDQGQCLSGWAFSATGAIEGQMVNKTGKLVSLSEQQLVDCSGSYGNMGCTGGSTKHAFEYVMANGSLESDNTYPFEAQAGKCRYVPSNNATTVREYVTIPTGDENALEHAVDTVGPVSISIDASHSSFQLYRSGVYFEPDCSSTELTHSVLVVGYGTIQNTDYWLVKNSYGQNWGLNGYIMMSRNQRNQCGVATAASYPLV